MNIMTDLHSYLFLFNLGLMALSLMAFCISAFVPECFLDKSVEIPNKQNNRPQKSKNLGLSSERTINHWVNLKNSEWSYTLNERKMK